MAYFKYLQVITLAEITTVDNTPIILQSWQGKNILEDKTIHGQKDLLEIIRIGWYCNTNYNYHFKTYHKGILFTSYNDWI